MTMNQKIKDFKTEIESFDKFSNEKIIWLFIATIGCWGIPEDHFRFFSFVVLFLLFWNDLIVFKKNYSISNTFPVHYELLKKEIQITFASSPIYLKEINNELENVYTTYLNKKSVFKRAWLFAPCWAFSSLSLIYQFRETMLYHIL